MNNKLVANMTDEELGRVVRTAFFTIPNHTKKCIKDITLEIDVESYGTEYEDKNSWALNRLKDSGKVIITFGEETHYTPIDWNKIPTTKTKI